ncbi:MAG: acylneuraminate cytidylyltransferase family protein [Candidatus Omnitrophica bacterium]|nr:acylneuraminate cytidylyltransferase family protein [Candidatus Omnitrophota bacterium]
MYKGKKIIAIIPARGGSKGLPQKNILPVAGKPLIAYSIEQALACPYIDQVLVSTDSAEIGDIAKKYGAEVPFLRPAHLALDKSSTMDVLLHAVTFLEEHGEKFEVMVLLHVTAPLRSVDDISNSISMLVDGDYDDVFSVSDAHRSPYFNMVEKKDHFYAPVISTDFVSRQQTPQVYDLNASIYVWWVEVFKRSPKVYLPKSGVYVMPKERSVDVDDAFDFFMVQCLMDHKNHEGNHGE